MNSNIKVINRINQFFKQLPNWIYIIPFLLHFLTTYYLLHGKPHNYSHGEPLYDIIMSNIPDFSKYHYIVNYIMIILMLPFIFYPKTKYFISIFKYFSIIIFIRCFTTIVTILPSCEKNYCKFGNNFLNYIFGHCNDKIFSGHTALSLILVYLLNYYKIVNKNLLYFFIFIQILIALLLVITKGHYTIDILIAYFITGTILLIISDL